MIAGWILSLVVALVTGLIKRAIAKQYKARQQDAETQQPQPAPAPAAPQPVRGKVRDAIFEGMTRAELLEAYGEPAMRSFPETSGKEVWTYRAAPPANDNPELTVTLSQGRVTGWDESWPSSALH